MAYQRRTCDKGHCLRFDLECEVKKLRKELEQLRLERDEEIEAAFQRGQNAQYAD